MSTKNQENKIQEAKKKIDSIVSSIDGAKEKVSEAKITLEGSKPADIPKAEKALEEAKSTLKSKVEQLEDTRIKLSQTGSYVPELKERKLFHVKMDKPSFSKTTGKKLSKAFIQKFTYADWNHFEKSSAGLGYQIEIMWNPTFYKL